MAGWLGGSIVGTGLAVYSPLAPSVAIGVGIGVGVAGAAGAMAISKPSDRSGSAGRNRSSEDSSGVGITTDGNLGMNLGGGLIFDTDGKVSFGFEL